MIYKFLGILLVLFFSLEINVSAQSISDIKKQKAKTEKEIAYLNSLLKEAEKNKSVSTQKLNILRQKIQQSKKLLSSLNQEVGLIQNNISANEQRIKELEENKKSMLDLYAKLVYGSWKKRNKTDKLMFIFSSADFNQAYNRFKYFQQIQEYSKRQLHMIQAVNDSLDVKNKELKDLFAQKNTALNEIGVQSKELESEQLKENQYIASLILHIYADYNKRLGAYKITYVLQRDYGINISVGRVYRLMKQLQLPKMSTDKPAVRSNSSDTEACCNHLQQKFN